VIVKKSDFYKTPKCTKFWHEILKIASADPAGVLPKLPRPPSREGLLASIISVLK